MALGKADRRESVRESFRVVNWNSPDCVNIGLGT